MLGDIIADSRATSPGIRSLREDKPATDVRRPIAHPQPE
jgi:hypothetical protein